MPENNQHQRFQELLPFYVTKKLDRAERQFMDEYLQRYPQAMGEIQITQRAYHAVRNLGANRNLDECSAEFMKQYQRPIYLSRWQRLLRKLDRHKDSFVFWLGSAVAAPVLLIEDLDVMLARFGNTFIELIHSLNFLPYLEQLFNPVVLESIRKIAERIA